MRERLARLFLRGNGRPPALRSATSGLQQTIPHFRDHLLFHEYFHGDTGAGLGASHQTGWSGLIALLLHPRDPRNPCLDVTGLTSAARPWPH